MLNPDQREVLLTVAEDSIRQGWSDSDALPVDADIFEQSLREPGACFVTLHQRGELQGCIGSLEPHRPLVEDVAENAFAAAFRDPRFLPLSREQWDELDLEISVLGPAEPVTFWSEADLLAQLRPGIDGLVLEEHHHRSTFLPIVWEVLPDPSHLLRQLKLKAGLTSEYWSDTIRIHRYGTEAFGRKVSGPARK
ncbi:AmmeMemoRadiSam system protein A [Thiohalomonas denitrificans]|uniref:AmmeMemoRadiSam system protein A n=1 Tax=Thiohalomonas denitrificans TaxID=415747 RepID=UPI0026F37220|nr:AmmeMemoRadiSam system protein A [Thiohalomonas denitrificans]